ncbi:disease resistance protein RGA2 [Prunus yedoensis var. nudiflora]|uniref:Disease resistance protein RGA2 n=1 Tax=Prunus yedoensis var. nudiflora TaxID=2094558 RepID=A0A314Y0L8_PRUYE|nr:disease resistance protein RGA2 [Prunus yedoensis var. nudiflora]
MDAAVGIILSPALQVLFDRLASPVLQGLADRLGFNYNIFQSLQHALVRAQATLADAEVQQFTNKTVRLWLSDLKNAVCDAEDLLDVFTAKQTAMIDEAFGAQTLDNYAVLTDKIPSQYQINDQIKGRRALSSTQGFMDERMTKRS